MQAAEPEQEPICIEIRRIGSRYEFAIRRSMAGPVQFRYTSPAITKANWRDLCDHLQQAAQDPLGPYALRDVGSLMWNLLLPRAVQRFLKDKEAGTPLTLCTDAPEIPWELLYDREEFLGVKFAVGRQWLTTGQALGSLSLLSSPSAPARHPSFLFIVNPTADLEGAEEEVKLIADGLPDWVLQRVLRGGDATVATVQMELSSGTHTVIHYTGHAVYDKKEKDNALLLAGRRALLAGTIPGVLRGQPLVFLSACGSDQRGDGRRRSALPTHITDSLAAAFIRGGARCVIGTHWEIFDRSSAQLAVHFYQQLLDKTPLGEALRQARLALRSAGPQEDNTWAAFVLYGDPSLTLDISPPDGADVSLKRGEEEEPPPEKEHLPLSTSILFALNIAAQEARAAKYPAVQTTHLLIGLTKIEEGATQHVLKAFGLDPRQVRAVMRQILVRGSPGAQKEREALAQLPLTHRIIENLREAEALARDGASSEVREAHLLTAVLNDREGITLDILQRLGLDIDRALEMGQGLPASQAKPSAMLVLDKLGRDLTAEAKQGELSPVIGRDQEMRRLVEILGRKKKNNPVLIGEAGVGKTAIVEGLAQRIVEGTVSPSLRDSRIVELPIASIVAGTKYRGDFEERLQQIIREAEADEQVILFLDEIHTLVGAGEGSGGSLDAASILKPALAQGAIRCIGATTTAEYRRYIEKDAALERRFQPVMVPEPNPADALQMLRGARASYEQHHQVRITDDAMEAAIELSVLHLPDRHLPDKAFDLIDQAGSRVRQQSREGGGVVTPQHVADIVAEWSGVPVAQLTVNERERLLQLEELLRRRVIGQKEAVNALAQAIRLARAGLKEAGRPVGVFLFLGPTGVGKTELAKALAEVLFGSEREIIRLDMSEFMERHTAAKLIGAPPGYVGYEEEGQLTGMLRRKPFSVVLLDEMEKAHPEVLDLFLQLFDEGRITDSHGRTADATNAIFILTSNVGTAAIEKRSMGFRLDRDTEAAEEARSHIRDELSRVFRPEFLNRIDEVIIFNALERDQIKEIARMQLGELEAHLSDRGIRFTVEEGVLDILLREGFDPRFGARPMRRAIERLLKRPISSILLELPPEPREPEIVVSEQDGRIEVILREGALAAP